MDNVQSTNYLLASVVVFAILLALFNPLEQIWETLGRMSDAMTVLMTVMTIVCVPIILPILLRTDEGKGASSPPNPKLASPDPGAKDKLPVIGVPPVFGDAKGLPPKRSSRQQPQQAPQPLQLHDHSVAQTSPAPMIYQPQPAPPASNCPVDVVETPVEEISSLLSGITFGLAKIPIDAGQQVGLGVPKAMLCRR